MDYALEPYDCKQPGGESGYPCQEEDGKRDETFPSGRVCEQCLHIDIRVRGIEVNLHGLCDRSLIVQCRLQVTIHHRCILLMNYFILILDVTSDKDSVQELRQLNT